MGTRGPAPRREAERRRTNAPAHPIDKLGQDELKALPWEVDLAPEPPPAMPHWHQIVVFFWESLLTDPARKWMTSADWAAAMLHAESMSRDLKPQVVGVHPETGEAVMASVPIKGANLASYQKFLAAIGITEAARLRIQKEITLFPTEAPVLAEVTDIASAREEGVQ